MNLQSLTQDVIIGVLALVAVGGTVALLALTLTVPAELYALDSLLVGALLRAAGVTPPT